MPRKMKNSKVILRIAGIAVILAGLLVGIPACRNVAEYLPLPYALPSAYITIETSTTSPSIENYSFVLEWVRPDGILYPKYDPTDTIADMDNIDMMNAALAKWEEYVKYTDPLPGYKKRGGEKVSTGVFSGGLLDNSFTKINANGSIIIPRYWPIGRLDSGLSPDRATWISSHEERVMDFQDTRASIEEMIAIVAASPLYETEDPRDQSKPLVLLHDMMEEYISYPGNLAFDDRPEFDIASSGTEGFLNPAKTGPMYEYYFGFIPENDDTGYVNPAGPFPYE